MFSPPNPVEALRNTMTQRLGPINTQPVQSTPMMTAVPKDGYAEWWDGKRCPFNYSESMLLEWPGVPTFEKGQA